MKKRVTLSSYTFTVSALSIAVLCGILLYIIKQPDNFWPLIIWGAVITLLLCMTMFYMPLSISVDNKNLNINRPLRIKSIPLSEISSVKLCPPTMGAIRICGSGGFFGWYGWFRESDIGKYFAYYGKASDCFLMTLKNGKKYMLGCQDAPEMVDTINKRI